VHLLTRGEGGEIRTESFSVMTKKEVATMLIERIISTLPGPAA
jgi:phosphopantothenoylcysteine decarboxylase/phosphopantothenate--cysteine ligase